jgi:hypothetical protein
MIGDVFVYSRGEVRLTAVVSGMTSVVRTVAILLGGMTDGLLFAGVLGLFAILA